MPFTVVLLPLALSIFGAGLVLLLLRRIRRTRDEAPMLAALVIILFFGYGVVYEGLPVWIPRIDALVKHRFTFPIWIALGLIAAFAVLRKKTPASPLAWNLGACCLLLLAGGSLVAKHYAVSHVSAGSPAPDRSGQVSGPDVYYIVLDGYGRKDELDRYYDLDNSDFLGYLESKGFWIADSSKSNYLETALSIPSSLNLAYLEDLKPKGARFDRWYTGSVIAGLMNRPAVFDYFKSLGYRTVNVSSGYQLSNNLTGADINLGYDFTLVEFNQKLLSLTLLRPFLSAPFELISGPQLLERFALLQQAADLNGPKFVFSHILSPHPPYEFDSAGNPTKFDEDHQGWTNRAGYAGQVKFDNGKVRKAIEHILAVSARPPIIVIQGDHGPSLLDSTPSRAWNAEWPADQFRAREGILNAYFAPKAVKDQLYPSITPVNSFRAILRATFGANLPQLRDETYFSTAAAPLDLSLVPK